MTSEREAGALEPPSLSILLSIHSPRMDRLQPRAGTHTRAEQAKQHQGQLPGRPSPPSQGRDTGS